MFADNDFKSKLISTDIVVWNGLVSRWGSVSPFVCDGDMIRMADQEEIDHYHGNQSWYTLKQKRSSLLDKLKQFVHGSHDNMHLLDEFQVIHAPDSTSFKCIPEEWRTQMHTDSYVMQFFEDGNMFAERWLGMESFEFPIAEKITLDKLIEHE